MSPYSTLLERLLLPSYNLLTGRKYAVHRAFLEQSQWWSRDQLVEFQWQELTKLLRHAWTTVPYYQRKYAAAGLRFEDIRTHDDLRHIPVLTREEINQHRDELRSPAFQGKVYLHATGGSSGVPTRFYVSVESFDWRTAATQRVYAWSGCNLGERTLYLWGAPIGKPSRFQSAKMKAFRSLRREFMFSSFIQSPEVWQRIYDEALRIRPPFIVAYVSSFEQFARFLLERNLRIPGVLAVIAAAEPVFDHHRQLAEQAFGAPLFNTYGSREFMSIGGECEHHQGMHINAENILLEASSGPEPSEILITDLHNYGMPFIRYSIGDIGTVDDAPCPCGRGLPRLKSIEGRVLDVLRTASGRIVPGEFFPHLMKDVPEIAEFQVEQKAPDHILVSVVLSRPLSERSNSLLASEIGRVFGDATRLEVTPVDAIPLRASGKRRVTIGLPA
jgi:phenylacetate-CoA ligase